MSEELLGLAEIAAERGESIQAVSVRHKRKSDLLPPADFVVGPKKRPYWRRETLERAKVLK